MPVRIASDLTVVDARVGTFQLNDGGTAFSPTQSIANVPENNYAWLIHLNTPRTQVKVREDLILPAAGNWGPGEDLTVSEDKRTGVRVRSMPVVDNQITNVWGVAPNDPSGSYMIRIWIEDVPVAEFKFALQ